MGPVHIKATEREEIIFGKPCLRTEEACRYFGLTYAPATLANRAPLYPKTDRDEWAIEKLGPLRSSTSETL